MTTPLLHDDDPPALDAPETVEEWGYRLTKHRFWGATLEYAHDCAERWALTVPDGHYAGSHQVAYDGQRWCVTVHLVTHLDPSAPVGPLRLRWFEQPEPLTGTYPGWLDDALRGALKEVS